MRLRPTTPAHSAVLLLAGALCACRPAASERELLVQATLHAEQGDQVAAEAAFAAALDAGGSSAELLVRYAAFRLDAGNPDGAALLLDRAEAMEMTQAERRRLDAERARWLRMRVEFLEAARTPGSDPAELLAAHERLAAIEQSGESTQQWARVIVREMRTAVGCAPEADCPAATVDAARLPPADAARALRLARLPERTAEPRPTFSDAERNELRALAALLERSVFEAGFSATFEAQHAVRLATEGRWDAQARELRVRYRGPFPDRVGPDEDPELILAAAQSILARRIVTDLASELRGLPPGDAPDLPLSARDLADVVAIDLAVTPDGLLTFVLRVPWSVALRSSWLLEQRIGRGTDGASGP